MRKTKLLIASLMCLGMGIGGAFAVVMSGDQKSVDTTFDQAVYLYWGAGESTAEIDDVTELEANKPQYRYLSCTPSASSTVNGNVNVTFTISGQTKDAKDYTLDGLQVLIYKGVTPPAEGDPVLPSEDLVATLEYDTEANRTKTVSFEVTNGVGSCNYCMKFLYDGSQKTGDEWGGLMTISQSFQLGA